MKPRFDAIIVGAGMGGAAAAYRLTQHGLRVIVLEAGPRFDPAKDYRLHRSDWEATGFPHLPGSEGRVTFAELQELRAEEDTLRSWSRASGRFNRGMRRLPSGPGYHHVRGVGGSTLHFTGEAHRLHPDAMRIATKYRSGVDWPVDYAALEPYYSLVERVIGVAGPAENGPRWRSAPYPLPPHRLSRPAVRLRDAGARLGMTWTANSRAALSRPYDGRPACNYCGNCTRGCPVRDKGSADVTFMRRAEATGRCELRTRAVALALSVRRDGSIAQVGCARGGKLEILEAPIVVLAGGAVETPRLLLANAGENAPHGVANAERQVGRNFVESLQWTSTGLVRDDLKSFQGLPSDAVCWDFSAPNAVPGVIGGCRFSSAVQEIGFVGPIAYATRAIAGFGAALKARVRETLGHALTVAAFGEFLPNDDTRITLNEKERDTHGVPLARIHSRVDGTNLTRLRFMAERSRALLREAGAAELVEEFGTYDFFSSTHVAGTCRMSSDPRAGVVDAFGKAHDARNLYITDGSVMPTVGGGEGPSLTIAALAVRTADRIAGASLLPPSKQRG